MVSGAVGEAYSVGFQQGEDAKYLLGILTLKHWAGYQVEAKRGGYNDVMEPFDLADSFLPAFRRAVKKGKAAGMM
jgi:beta-glucosidase